MAELRVALLQLTGGRSDQAANQAAGEAACRQARALRAYRRREVWGDAFRRPHRYGLLTESAVTPPFPRVNAAGQRHDQTRGRQ